jgi:hypothetical protein
MDHIQHCISRVLCKLTERAHGMTTIRAQITRSESRMQHLTRRKHVRDDVREQQVAEIVTIERAEQDGARVMAGKIGHREFSASEQDVGALE